MVSWIPVDDIPVPSLTELKKWLMEGEKKLTIDDETNFCDPNTLLQVLQCKVSLKILNRNDVEVLHFKILYYIQLLFSSQYLIYWKKKN